MKISMLRWIGWGVLLSANLGVVLQLRRQRRHPPIKSNGLSVTVAFGSGLNTLPPSGPSGPENHHVFAPEFTGGS
jgi:hypothetical protein